MSEENKKIKIVDGDGSTLDISPVYNHIKDVIPKKKILKKILLFLVKKKLKKNRKRFIVMNFIFIYYKSFFIFLNYMILNLFHMSYIPSHNNPIHLMFLVFHNQLHMFQL